MKRRKIKSDKEILKEVEALKRKKSKKFYAEKLSITEEDVELLLKELRAKEKEEYEHEEEYCEEPVLSLFSLCSHHVHQCYSARTFFINVFVVFRRETSRFYERESGSPIPASLKSVNSSLFSTKKVSLKLVFLYFFSVSTKV